MTTPERPTAAIGDPNTPGTRLAGQQDAAGEVAAARGERESRLGADEAQLRQPLAAQPHGRSVAT